MALEIENYFVSDLRLWPCDLLCNIVTYLSHLSNPFLAAEWYFKNFLFLLKETSPIVIGDDADTNEVCAMVCFSISVTLIKYYDFHL